CGAALPFLWQWRALLTGNESSAFLGGSFIFPLAGNPSSGNPPTLANQTGTFDPNLNATGAWVGMSDSFELFVELRRQGASTPTVCHIPIAQLNGGVLNRPTITGGLVSQVANILQTPLPIGSGGLQITATPDGKRVTLFNQPLTGTSIPGFDGNYALHLDLAANAPIAFRVSTPRRPLFLIFKRSGARPSRSCSRRSPRRLAIRSRQ